MNAPQSSRIHRIPGTLTLRAATTRGCAPTPVALPILGRLAAGAARFICITCLATLAMPAHAQKVIGSFVTGSKPMAIAVNPATNKIYVVNDDTSGKVTVIDGVTDALTTVAVGTNPDAIAVNTATNKVYVANANGNNVTVIDGATNTTTTVAVGNSPDSIAVNQTTDKIYVVNVSSVNAGKGTVTAIDGATNVATTIATGGIKRPREHRANWRRSRPRGPFGRRRRARNPACTPHPC
jgi:YVTN family beta-propeller protein